MPTRIILPERLDCQGCALAPKSLSLKREPDKSSPSRSPEVIDSRVVIYDFPLSFDEKELFFYGSPVIRTEASSHPSSSVYNHHQPEDSGYMPYVSDLMWRHTVFHRQSWESPGKRQATLRSAGLSYCPDGRLPWNAVKKRIAPPRRGINVRGETIPKNNITTFQISNG